MNPIRKRFRPGDRVYARGNGNLLGRVVKNVSRALVSVEWDDGKRNTFRAQDAHAFIATVYR